MALTSDFVREIVTATGTADYTLTGSPGNSPYIPFLTGFSSGSEVLYVVKSSSYKWEVVLGTVTSPSTLSRTTVIASWNGSSLGTSKISWSGGDGTLFASCTTVAENVNGRFNGSKATDIASATTTDLGAAFGQYVHVTGTTTITGFGTVHAGTWRQVRFTGALTLTYNATSMILPSAADITTAAGDTATFVSLGSGNWVCTDFQRASGRAIRETYEYDMSTRVTNQSEIALTGIPSWVTNVRFMWQVQPVTNNVTMYFQSYGADGLVDNGASDYAYTSCGIISSSGAASLGSSHGYPGVAMGGAVSNNSTNLHHGWLEAYDIQSATRTQFNGQLTYLFQDSSGWGVYNIWGIRFDADRITGGRIVCNTGNITGYMRVIGMR